MNIAIVTDSIRKNATGIGFYAQDIASKIVKKNIENNYTFLDYATTSFNKNHLTLINNPFTFFKTYLWHNFLPLKTKSLNVDYICNLSAVPHLIPFRQKEIFFVYDISWYLYPEYHPLSRVLFYKATFQNCLKKSSRIVVDSLSTQNDLVTIFHIPKEKISIVYPTVLHIPKDNKPRTYSFAFPYMLYIGTLEPRKNIETIILAFKELKQTYHLPHKLLLCGKKGWKYDSIFRLIQSLNLENDVLYLGYITDGEKKYLYKHAEFFVYPSFYEGFGIPVLEAMRYGCPVITSNVSSLPEVIGNAGITVDPHDTHALMYAMKRLLVEKILRKKMVTAGYQQVKKLSNEKQIENLIHSL